MKFSKIYLLHGLGGSPKGTVSLLQDALKYEYPKSEFVRPLMPHNNYNIKKPDQSVKFLEELDIPRNSLLIGISLGGLVVAKLQERSRPDLHVICISSPTSFKTINLKKKMSNRVVFYSSKDEVITDRVSDWPALAESHDLSWLDHDTDPHIPKLVKLIKEYSDKK